jgi:hypothetical protein
MAADQPEFKDYDENDIRDRPDDARLKEDICASAVDQE